MDGARETGAGYGVSVFAAMGGIEVGLTAGGDVLAAVAEGGEFAHCGGVVEVAEI